MAKGPKSPDPTATANAQAEYNVKAGTQQQGLNMVDQTTPFGSLKYSQVGTNPDGTPKFEANQSYSAPVQSAYDQLLGNINQSAAGGNNITAQQMALYDQYYRPLIDRAHNQLDTKLYNQGITSGGSGNAYNNAQNLFARNEGDQQTNWLLNSIGAAQSVANQPYTQLASLRTGAAPGFAQTPTVQVQPPNYSGLVAQDYQNKVASANALNQGIFGTIGAIGGGWARGGFGGF